MPEKKIKLWGWAVMLLFPLIIGSSYFIFFSDSLKIFSGSSNSKQTKVVSKEIQGKKKAEEKETVIKGVIATKAKSKAPEKIQKDGELWPNNKDKKEQKIAKTKKSKLQEQVIRVKSQAPLANVKHLQIQKTKAPSLKSKQQRRAKSSKEKKKFSVRIGIFRIAKNAGILINKARKSGYQAFVTIRKTKIKEKRIYIGSFAKISDVRKARKIFSKQGIENHPKMSNGNTYSVYLGPFPLKKNTNKMEILSKKNGYKALVRTEKTERDLSYVWIGKFDTKGKARALASKLRKHFPDCITGRI